MPLFCQVNDRNVLLFRFAITYNYRILHHKGESARFLSNDLKYYLQWNWNVRRFAMIFLNSSLQLTHGSVDYFKLFFGIEIYILGFSILLFRRMIAFDMQIY